jgi:hypothetical protein
MAKENDTETLSFSIQDLNRMRLEFSDCYEHLFADALMKLKQSWLIRLRAMKECRAQLREFNRNEKAKSQSSSPKKVKQMATNPSESTFRE